MRGTSKSTSALAHMAAALEPYSLPGIFFFKPNTDFTSTPRIIIGLLDV